MQRNFVDGSRYEDEFQQNDIHRVVQRRMEVEQMHGQGVHIWKDDKKCNKFYSWNTRKIKNMEMEFMNGLMKENMLAVEFKEGNMELEFIIYKIKRFKLDYGMKEKNQIVYKI